MRNPDEFYHKMKNARFDEGTHKVILSNNEQSDKARKLAERADLAIVQMHRQIETKKAEKIQANLHLIDLPKSNNHIRFVSSLSEVKQSQIADDAGEASQFESA